MSRFRVLAGSGLAFCLVLAGTAGAQAPRERAVGRSSGEVRRASEVIGAHVRLESGRAEARVVDLVLNERGCAEFVVVSLHDKFIAVPFDFVTVDFGDRVVRLDMSEDRLREAPSFDRDNFRMLSEARFRERVSRFFARRSERGDRGEGRGAARDDTRREPRIDRTRRGTEEQPAVPRSPADRVVPPNPSGTGQPRERLPNQVNPTRRPADMPPGQKPGEGQPNRNSTIPPSRPEGAPR